MANASVSYIGGSLGNNGQSATAATVAMTPHASAVAGDTAIASFDASSGSVTVTVTPAGWKLQSGPDKSSTVNEAWVYTKILQPADLGASASWTISSSSRCCGIMDIFRGVDTYLLLDNLATANSAVSSTVLTAPNVVIARSNVFIYEVFSGRTATTINTSPTPSAAVTVTSFSSTGYVGAANLSMTGAYRTVTPTTGGTYGSDTMTYTNTNTNKVTYTMGLIPISAPNQNNYEFMKVGDGMSTSERIR